MKSFINTTLNTRKFHFFYICLNLNFNGKNRFAESGCRISQNL